MLQIRNYQTTDWETLYRICLETGDSGADATHLYTDPKLLGHFYAAPYASLEPELVFVLEDGSGVCGYILGTTDSQGFARKMEQDWLPALRLAYPLPPETNTSRDAAMIRIIHKGYSVSDTIALEYPAHLHIDILARAQQKGQGKLLMQTFFRALQTRGVPGVHLGVGSRNLNGIAFYERIGFTRLEEHPWGITFGMKLV